MASERRTKNGQHSQAGQDLAEQQGLPCSLDAERYVLAFLLKEGELSHVTEILSVDDLHLESHRRILTCILEVADAGEKPNHVMVADALRKRGWLEFIGGLTALVSLDRDMPEISDIGGYCRKIKDKSGLRKLIFNAQQTLDRAMHEVGTAEEIADWASESIAEVQSGQNQKQEHGSTPEQIIESYPGGISNFLDPTRRARGLPSGFDRLDDATCGFHKGELTIIGARPSIGKTGFLLNIASHLCLHPRQRRMVAIFSLEMTSPTLLTRMMCSHARVDQHKFRAGYLNNEERRKLQVALSDILESKLKLFDKFGITMPEICKHIRYMVKEEGLDLAAVDYLGLIGVTRKGENRNLDISEMTRQFKILAGECNIPIIVLSQLSRAGDKRTGASQAPQLSDLRDSGSIEQDADSVFLLDRPEVRQRDREDLKGLADLIIAKQRNGPTLSIPLRFMGGYVRFENRTDDLPDVEQSGLHYD